MLFVTQLRILPGQFEEATRLFKHPKLPNNVMVHEFLGLLGKPDAIVIFEAPEDHRPRGGMDSSADFLKSGKAPASLLEGEGRQRRRVIRMEAPTSSRPFEGAILLTGYCTLVKSLRANGRIRG